jgi:enoyl-CoA hydratase
VIELTHQDDVAVLRMADGKANVMSLDFCRAMTARLEEVAASPAAAVVITGNGRIFSAGVDLVRLLDGGPPYIREFLPALSAMLAAAFAFPKPLVAAINGHAVAGGCVLACAADRRVMAREAGRIGTTELLVGVPLPPAAMEVMRNATAPHYLEEAIFSGATYTPPDALARGLIHEIVEPEALTDRTLANAKALAALPPAAFALSKRQIREPHLHRIDNSKEVDAAIEQIWTASETLERIRDYVARTLRKQ